MVMIQSDFYSKKEFALITNKLNIIDSEKLIKRFTYNWLQTKEMQNILSDRPTFLERNYKTGIINRFIVFVGKFILIQEDFTWENYCKIQHEIPLVSIKNYRLPLREMTRNLYLYTLSSELISNEKVKKFIKQYSYLLLSNEFNHRNIKAINNPFTLNNIITYFPLNSTMEQVIQAEYVSSIGELVPTNFL